MIGLDTNVLVRCLTQDDPEQSARANRLIEAGCTRQEPGRISDHFISRPGLAGPRAAETAEEEYDQATDIQTEALTQLVKTRQFMSPQPDFSICR